MADSVDGFLDVELLVHVTAPARAVDDVLYRQLAQAYLNFETETSRQSSQLPDEAPTQSSADWAREEVGVAPGSPPPSQDQRCLDRPDGRHSSEAQSRYAVIDSQDLSFQSVMDNRLSPRLKSPRNTDIKEPSMPTDSWSAEDIGQSKRWVTPPSQISDSYPIPDTMFRYASPTRLLQQFLDLPPSSGCDSPRDPSLSTSFWGDFSTSLKAPSPRRSPRHHQSSVRVQGHNKLDAPSLCFPAVDSATGEAEQRLAKVTQTVIPGTPMGSKALDTAQERVGQPSDDFDDTHPSSTGSSLPVLPSSSRGESEPPLANQPREFNDSTAQIRHDAAALIRSVSDVGPASSSSPFSSTLTHKQLDALEVLAPPPPVGVGILVPEGMIPANLAKLADKLSSRYRPTAVRDIEPLERGYWAVDCSSWSSETRRQAWVFLFRYIETGMASWGVWCRRSQRHDSLRLYCWGHLVKHTYLLLYLASERALKYTGANWKDGEGKVIVQVLPVEKSQRETA